MQKVNEVMSRLDVQRLSEDIYISYSLPTSAENIAACSKDPRLVIIFGWMDAPAQLVFSKYAIKYRQMYRNSDIVVVCTRTPFLWRPEKWRKDIARPLAEYVLKTVYTQSAKTFSGVLLHVLSNGGALNLLIFSEVLHGLFASASFSERLPHIRASLVLDSTPGGGEWMSAYKTFLKGFGMNTSGRSIAKGGVAAATSAIWVGYTLKNKVEGLEGLFTRLDKFLLREDILPCSADPVQALHPRLYIYSTMDDMVPFSAVERHISHFLRNRSLAYEERGARVWVRKLDRQGHLAGERVLKSGRGAEELSYWDLIDAVWARSASLDGRAKL